jgi:hypothetical protein
LDDQAKTYNQTYSSESAKIPQNRFWQSLENDQIKPAVTNQAKILQNRSWQSLENIFQQHKNTNTAFLIIRRSTIGHRQQTSRESGEN